MKSSVIVALAAALLAAPVIAVSSGLAVAQSCSNGLVAAGVGNGNIDMSTIKGAPSAKIRVLPDCTKVDVATQLTSRGQAGITAAIAGNPSLTAVLQLH